MFSSYVLFLNIKYRGRKKMSRKKNRKTEKNNNFT